MIGYGKTDKGILRTANEDNIFVSNKSVGRLNNLYIVADGMGGHKAGNIASLYVIKYFLEYVNSENSGDDILDILVSGVDYANNMVYEMSLSNYEYSGMGTTFLAASIVGSKVFIVHVGDCRLYIFRQGSLAQITTDHTFVMEMVREGEITIEEARTHPKRNVITRALGVDSKVYADGLFSSIEDNDIILMCSDGLTEMVSSEEILAVLLKDKSLEGKIDELIDIANAHGGKDNISVVLIGN